MILFPNGSGRIIKLFITFDAYNPNIGVPWKPIKNTADKQCLLAQEITNNFNPIWKRILSGLLTPKGNFHTHLHFSACSDKHTRGIYSASLDLNRSVLQKASLGH